MWSWTVNFYFKLFEMFCICLYFSDISFLCEATTAIMTQDQQNKSAIQQRTTDKSAIRAIQNELQPESVCYNFI